MPSNDYMEHALFLCAQCISIFKLFSKTFRVKMILYLNKVLTQPISMQTSLILRLWSTHHYLMLLKPLRMYF